MAELQPYNPGFWARDYDPTQARWKDTESELGGFDVDVRAPPDVQAVTPDIRGRDLRLPPGPPGEAAWRQSQAVPSILQQSPQYDRDVMPPTVSALSADAVVPSLRETEGPLSNWNVDAQHQLQQDIRREETDPTSRIQSMGQGAAAPPQLLQAQFPIGATVDSIQMPNLDALIEISGNINPSGQFTEEHRVPADLADPSIAQGPVGWYPENWHALSKSEYPFIPSDLGGHYTSRGPEGSPRLVYNMAETGIWPEGEDRDIPFSNISDPNFHFQKHERYHDAGHIMHSNMDWWGDVEFEGKPLKETLAPNGVVDRKLMHAIIYASSPEAWGRERVLEYYEKHPFFSDQETGFDKFKKVAKLAKAFDEAAGNVYNAFIEGGIEDPKKGGAWVPWQWGQGSAVGFSSGQGLKSFYLED
jgi:hypothetical protein